MNPLSLLSVGAALALLPFLFQPSSSTVVPEGPQYIGSAKCKQCHNSADKGMAYDTWSKSEHAKAFETLAGDKAKAIAKEKGIADPQKADACLQCHVTGHGVPAAQIKRGFKVEDGVQCESCHGPGSDHASARMKDAMKPGSVPLTKDEIASGTRSMELCGKCHNDKSPTFKPPFCIKEMMAKIEHLDPRKKRSEEELKKLRETCNPDCPKCKAAKEEKK